MKKLKHAIRTIPVIGPMLARLYVRLAERHFRNSADYWQQRYERGGTSGDGSYADLARFKAEIVNNLVNEYGIRSVIEFGCGDGNQLKLAKYPVYLGLDVSQKAIEICREEFRDDETKSFRTMEEYSNESADASMSLDVIYHLVEDDVFEEYMRTLFAAARSTVIIYASNSDIQDSPQLPHVRHRHFTRWLDRNAPRWDLQQEIENRFPLNASTGEGSPSSFFVYRKRKT